MENKLADGRTDLVFDYPPGQYPPDALQNCACYGDVSAIRYLIINGASLRTLGSDLGLIRAAFHGHWRLVQFLLENGADANASPGDTGETPPHAALCKANSLPHKRVIQVLLANGANPNVATSPGKQTGGFMRDCRTKGETPLHRAAAFADEETIQMLLDAGARPDVRDANGDSPLTWASWYLRPTPILTKLLFGDFYVRPDRQGMEAFLLGNPHL